MGPLIERPKTSRLAPHRRYFPIPRPDPAGSDPRRGLYAGEPETCRRDLRKFVAIFAHLGILLLAFGQYRIEGRGFQLVAQFAFFGLPVHYLLPYRWKKPFFLALSTAGLIWVFGLPASAWVFALAASCIGLARLPIDWKWRAMLVSSVGVVALLLRPGAASWLIPETVWPVVGSILTFRMIIYLYELKHSKKPEPLIDAFGYFFMLPNFCFIHFPVVDYRTWQRGYFADDVHKTQQAGLRMIFRGMIQLLAYRLVYHELLISASEVHNFWTLTAYVVCNYLLYLHVSGQFHMACGILHLFGHSLPETHHSYLLATSFTDYWRRINIYWKDFMVRVVFNPVAFQLKRHPQWRSLAAATISVFVVTWFLHALQSYWIRGVWGFSIPDALFWGILGAFVVVNVQINAAHPPARLSKTSPTVRERLSRACRVSATFVTIALLWSLWSSPSLAEWSALLRRGFSV